MDRAAPATLVCWMARHCLRVLTGLAILALALGASEPAGAAGAAFVESASVGSVAHSAEDAEDTAPVETAVAVEQVPARVRPPRPAPVSEPLSGDVAAVGQRAPPAAVRPATVAPATVVPSTVRP